MSWADDMMALDSHKESTILEFLIEYGLIERCPTHEDYTMEVDSLESAIELAQERSLIDDIPEDFESWEEFILTLPMVYGEYAGDGCALCGHYCESD